MKPDLSFVETGLFTRFVPNTSAGEDAWRELAKQSEGSGAFLTIHTPAVIKQLRAAGYTVSRCRVSGPLVLTSSDLKLLAELSNF